MKFLRLGLILPLVICACHGTAPQYEEAPRPLQLRAMVDNAKPATNDTILYTVTVDMDERLKVEVPQFGASIAGLRVTDFGHKPPQKVAGREITDYWYKLRADISGVYVLPPIEINYEKPDWYQDDGYTDFSARTAEIFLEVDSRLADGSSMVLRELKELPKVPAEIPWLWLIIGAVVLIPVAVILLVRHREQQDIIVQRPAHEIAYDALASLVDTVLSDEKEQRNFFFKLSSVLKEYLENRFEINATDMTTEEISQVLIKVTALDDPHRRVAINMLRAYDRVKYAGILLERANGNDDVAEVKRFVDDTREVIAGVEEE